MKSQMHLGGILSKTQCTAAVVLLTSLLPCWGGMDDTVFTTRTPLPERSVLVVGFLGAWEKWDNPKRSVRKVVLSLRDRPIPGLYAESVENHSRKLARKFVRKAFDRDGDGKISSSEATASGLILYGQSFGAAAAVKLSRELQKEGIPVELIVMVDSIGRGDSEIPANVRRIMNFYQRDPGPIRGESRITPVDPSKTKVLGNVELSYLLRFDITLEDYPTVTRFAPLSHWRMDNDPYLWKAVEGLIRAQALAWKANNP